jgi:hypothetical protein
MASFKSYYRSSYRTFGYPLTKRMGTPPNVLTTAEKRLGVRIPTALRDYYLVAGREHRFNTSHNRCLPPENWVLDQQRLLFMEENQRVCFWGVATRNPDSDDPPVSQGVNDEPITWYPEHRKCSVFLAVMLHYQAVSGGYEFTGRAELPDPGKYRFENNGWTSYGEVNKLRAFSRANQVVCLMPPANTPLSRDWSVLAGGRTERDLETIAAELELPFDFL